MAIATLSPVRTVLIASADTSRSERWAETLAGAGQLAFRVATVADLLARVRENAQRFDLLLLDLRITSREALELVRALRAIPGLGAQLVVLRESIEDATLLPVLAALGVSCCRGAEQRDPWEIMRLLAPYLYRDGDHHRATRRAALSVRVTCLTDGGTTEGVTLNISERGVAVRTEKPIALASQIRVRFELPGTSSPIDTWARVLWVDRLLGMGLEFMTTSPGDQARIEEFVRVHAPAPREA